MISSLSDLLRASLDGSGTHEVPLQRELEILKLFTGIESIRFGDRIKFREDLEPETQRVLVPSLLLQPVVENAIRHGLEPGTGHGTVTVAARRRGEQLELTVHDDGAGLPQGGAPESGIGLTNTRARLQALYGENQSMTIAAAAGGGTLVTVSIPWHTT